MENDDKDFYMQLYATMIMHDLEYNNYAGDGYDTPFFKENLNLIEHNIIALLTSLGETTMSDLAKKLTMLPSNLSPIVKNLEKQGLTERKRSHPDKRFVSISLSDKGKELVKEQSLALTERLKNIMNASLTKSEQHDFAEIYERLVFYFKKMNSADKAN